ncbi:ABC transporter permease [Actinoallomurus iriomotensis]|jgi:osmoprotectant transport system permease protein|uniref:ABC transporter permease n=1 Tax=Actinoallomurus iriomotensis TaxID=478107 RepID=A0A9W6VTG5_9ACTN|nr:ABC transporter permease [Actinoallomurus iriomotensis]GLY84458.1 ABC transporter permease [Actinoallomurus iriomotensis]
MNLTDQINAAWNWLTASAHWSGSDGIPHRLLEHLGYSVLALVIAAVIALPLGALVGHTGRGGFIVVSFANLARAVPTLGLLLLVVTVTSIGLTPVIIPLIALAMPPILVNTYEGIRGVDADIKDAAKGMGMKGPGVLLKAEIPVALPLILLGLRTAAIQVVATATIAAYAGIGGLGRYIVDGLARKDYPSVVGGSVLVVLLAVIVQVAFIGIRRAFVSPGLRGSSRTS